MAVGFRRRLAALTVPKNTSSLRRRKEVSCSCCSASIPGRIHPVVAGLHDSVNALLGWTLAPAQAGTAWIGDGMDHLNRLLAGLNDMLHQPQVQDQERRRCKTASSWTERLLRDLIILADAHSSFCEVLQSLKQLLAEAQAAVRHHDAARLTAALGTRRHSDRALSRLTSTMCALSRRSSSSASATTDSGETELAEIIDAATCVAAAASAVIFAALASSSASSALRVLSSQTAAPPAEVLQRLRRLEECVVAAEDGCELVHRGLVTTRVSLLNVLTPC